MAPVKVSKVVEVLVHSLAFEDEACKRYLSNKNLATYSLLDGTVYSLRMYAKTDEPGAAKWGSPYRVPCNLYQDSSTGKYSPLPVSMVVQSCDTDEDQEVIAAVIVDFADIASNPRHSLFLPVDVCGRWRGKLHVTFDVFDNIEAAREQSPTRQRRSSLKGSRSAASEKPAPSPAQPAQPAPSPAPSPAQPVFEPRTVSNDDVKPIPWNRSAYTDSNDYQRRAVADNLENTKSPRSVRRALLQTSVVEAKLDSAKDWYVLIGIGDAKHRTVAIRESNPRWNEQCSFYVNEPAGLALNVEIWDERSGLSSMEPKAELVSTGSIAMDTLEMNKPLDAWYKMQGVRGEQIGSIRLRTVLEGVPDKSNNPDVAVGGRVFVNCVEGRGLQRKDCYIRVRLGDSAFKTERADPPSRNPQWNALAAFDCPNVINSSLEVEVMYQDRYLSAEFPGRFSVPLTILREQSSVDQWYQAFNNAGKYIGDVRVVTRFEPNTTRVTSTPVRAEKMPEWIPAGRLSAVVVEGRQLAEKECYVKLAVGSSVYRTTPAAPESGHSASWNEQFKSNVANITTAVASVELWAANKFGSDLMLGSFLVPLAMLREERTHDQSFDTYNRQGNYVGTLRLTFDFVPSVDPESMQPVEAHNRERFHNPHFDAVPSHVNEHQNSPGKPNLARRGSWTKFVQDYNPNNPNESQGAGSGVRPVLMRRGSNLGEDAARVLSSAATEEDLMRVIQEADKEFHERSIRPSASLYSTQEQLESSLQTATVDAEMTLRDPRTPIGYAGGWDDSATTGEVTPQHKAGRLLLNAESLLFKEPQSGSPSMWKQAYRAPSAPNSTLPQRSPIRDRFEEVKNANSPRANLGSFSLSSPTKTSEELKLEKELAELTRLRSEERIADKADSLRRLNHSPTRNTSPLRRESLDRMVDDQITKIRREISNRTSVSPPRDRRSPSPIGQSMRPRSPAGENTVAAYPSRTPDHTAQRLKEQVQYQQMSRGSSSRRSSPGRSPRNRSASPVDQMLSEEQRTRKIREEERQRQDERIQAHRAGLEKLEAEERARLAKATHEDPSQSRRLIRQSSMERLARLEDMMRDVRTEELLVKRNREQEDREQKERLKELAKLKELENVKSSEAQWTERHNRQKEHIYQNYMNEPKSLDRAEVDTSLMPEQRVAENMVQSSREMDSRVASEVARTQHEHQLVTDSVTHPSPAVRRASMEKLDMMDRNKAEAAVRQSAFSSPMGRSAGTQHRSAVGSPNGIGLSDSTRELDAALRNAETHYSVDRVLEDRQVYDAIGSPRTVDDALHRGGVGSGATAIEQMVREHEERIASSSVYAGLSQTSSQILNSSSSGGVRPGSAPRRSPAITPRSNSGTPSRNPNPVDMYHPASRQVSSNPFETPTKSVHYAEDYKGSGGKGYLQPTQSSMIKSKSPSQRSP